MIERTPEDTAKFHAQMSTIALSNLIGKTAMFSNLRMKFPVRILDTKKAFGRIDALIEPIGGQGQKWIDASQLTMIEED
jgi:hypothetical protein